ncbi:hypothetical protein HBI29_198180 [Parastagonospora nodorum]|nr:hypothetical protein HBH50_059200 [Parastagonospora nodorum]KAH4088925.1 hypothetical protein HBH48_120720 [Parastagonospora nodorum]KAH5491600.1 hypothetical protein HBI29_198180 [Parastagonospora nodorum]
MLPTAGLFLPETLHRSDRPAPSYTDTDGPRLKYFQRKSGQTKHEAREAEVSSIPPSDLASVDNKFFPSITIAFQFADFVFSSSRTSSDAHTLAYLIHRVRQDVSEASRLYLSPAVSTFLDAWPDKKTWINAIFTDVRRALNDVGSYMDTFRVAGYDGGAVELKKRFEWIASHQKKLLARQQLLSTCHQSLVSTINVMQTVELCGVTNGTLQDPIYEAPVQPWVKNDAALALRGPYSRREYRMSQKTLSMSSVNLTQADQDSIETQSINSLPAELPGSTPDDIIPSHHPPVTIPTRYRPSSNRRLQFEKTFRNSPLYRAGKFSSIGISTTLPDLAQSNPKSQTEDCIIGHPFDGSLRTPSSPEQVRMTSFDSARPYKEMQASPIQPVATFAPLASLEQDQAPPVLSEKTIERNVSTASTIAVVSVPRIAKRYIPNPIYIRKSVDKHRSLPTELPHVQSQSSLTEDLADWMDIPRVQSEKLHSTEWDTSSVVASSSMSVASCPAVSTTPLQHPEIRQKVLEQYREVDLEASASTSDILGSEHESGMQQITAQDPISRAKYMPRQHSVTSHGRAASVRSTSSIVSRKPLSPTAKVSHKVIIPEIVATVLSNQVETGTESAHNAELTLLQQRMLSQTYITKKEENQTDTQAIGDSSVVVDIPDGLSQTCVEREEIQADAAPKPEELVALPEKPLVEDQGEEEEEEEAQAQAKTLLEPLPTPPGQSTIGDEERIYAEAVSKPEEQTRPPAQPTAAETEISAHEYTGSAQSPVQITDVDKIAITPPPTLVKPMTAQAKRRAAHQRRMELAFGKA